MLELILIDGHSLVETSLFDVVVDVDLSLLVAGVHLQQNELLLFKIGADLLAQQQVGHMLLSSDGVHTLLVEELPSLPLLLVDLDLHRPGGVSLIVDGQLEDATTIPFVILVPALVVEHGGLAVVALLLHTRPGDRGLTLPLILLPLTDIPLLILLDE